MDRRLERAASTFREIHGTGGSALNPHSFPLDVFGNGDAGVGEFADRLPRSLRDNADVRRLLSEPDPGRGEAHDPNRTSKLGAQEVLAAHEYARQRGIDLHDVGRGSTTDFVERRTAARDVPFDPFMSPSEIADSGHANPSLHQQEIDWARGTESRKSGAYYKHTHGKGGHSNTVGVWDQTYSSPEQVARLRRQLRTTDATERANVAEVRVPLARHYAQEHVQAEREIDQRRSADAHWKETERRYRRAQRRKPPHQRVELDEAIREQRNGRFTQRARHWRAVLAEHPVHARALGTTT